MADQLKTVLDQAKKWAAAPGFVAERESRWRLEKGGVLGSAAM